MGRVGGCPAARHAILHTIVVMQIGVLTAAKIAKASNETASALLRPSAESVPTEDRDGVNMIVHEITTGLDTFGQAAVAISSFRHSLLPFDPAARHEARRPYLTGSTWNRPSALMAASFLPFDITGPERLFRTLSIRPSL